MTTKADWEAKPGPLPHQQPKVVAVGSGFRRDNLASTRAPDGRTRYKGSSRANRPSDERIASPATPKATATACSIGHRNDFIQNANRRARADYFSVYAR